ncbi:MAG: DsbA family protein [Pseudomonadota bacterium]|jgi:protein-disulfide isomerase|nr:DsbA family protein [Pseudomonadota bacterium]MEE3322879.1 DsbA family protein [Pseudomonadota bacterium]
MYQRRIGKLSLAVLAVSALGVAPAVAKEKASAENMIALSEAQKTEVNDMIHQFIMNNPEVLLESVELYQQRLEDERASKSKTASKDLLADIKAGKLDVPFAGDLESDFLVVEFLDYNCGFCKRGFTAVQGVMEKGGVKFAFIDLPVLGNSSREAAKYALAAKIQGKYVEFHDELFKQPSARSENGFVKIAEQIGLDVDKLKADANGDVVKAELERNRALADKLGISGTPAFIVEDEFVPGYVPEETLQSMIDEQKK